MDIAVPAGRTPLAKVRDYLAARRSQFADQRTAMSRGRTGLAFFRTGIALITIAVTLLRAFGTGILTLFDVALIVVGVVAIYDGLRWYVPVRLDIGRHLEYKAPARPEGISVLEVEDEAGTPRFIRSRLEPCISVRVRRRLGHLPSERSRSRRSLEQHQRRRDPGLLGAQRRRLLQEHHQRHRPGYLWQQLQLPDSLIPVEPWTGTTQGGTQ